MQLLAVQVGSNTSPITNLLSFKVWHAAKINKLYTETYQQKSKVFLNAFKLIKKTRSTQRAQTSAEHSMTIWTLDSRIRSVIRIATKIVSLGPWAMPYSYKKFRQNPFTSLRVIWRTDRQTNRQTDRTKNVTSFFGGGNKSINILILP